MAGAGLPIFSEAGFWKQARDSFSAYALLVLLAAYTLSTCDGGEIAPWIISAALFLLVAFRLGVPANQKLSLGLPLMCVLTMCLWGLLQTLLFPQKITYNGWITVLFWFAAAMITVLAQQLFIRQRRARDFRLWFIVFGTAVCLLDLLEQASHTNRYFWLVPSRYPNVFGPFAYWNNFAQFVELLLPVTLWRGLGGRRPQPAFLLCAALQIAAAISSGSRAGTVLVMAELVTLICFAFSQYRNRALLLGAGLALALSALFVYAAGFQTVLAKLQANDQLAVRRNIDRSSLAMIRARPLTGWGLGTYVPVYRMFALYDDGTYVNRAHNDWLEWTAEGGVFFVLPMLIVTAWSIRPAIRSGWGLGLIALSLHALVDYPFARLGVCGWYFCLLGMLYASVRTGIARAPAHLRSVNAPAYLKRAFPPL